MFNNETIRIAIGIMDRLLERPASYFFRHEVIPGVDADADYSTIITNPQDLTTIQKRLKNNEYKEIYKWMEDVETVWTNAEKYNGPESLVKELSREMRLRFEKERKLLALSSFPYWSNEIHHLRCKVEKLFQKAPSKVGKLIPDFYFMILPQPREIDLTQHEIQCLKLALEKMRSKDSLRIISNAIKKRHPDLPKDITLKSLDIGTLDSPALRAIQQSVMKSFELQKMKYPE